MLFSLNLFPFFADVRISLEIIFVYFYFLLLFIEIQKWWPSLHTLQAFLMWVDDLFDYLLASFKTWNLNIPFKFEELLLRPLNFKVLIDELSFLNGIFLSSFLSWINADFERNCFSLNFFAFAFIILFGADLKIAFIILISHGSEAYLKKKKNLLDCTFN